MGEKDVEAADAKSELDDAAAGNGPRRAHGRRANQPARGPHPQPSRQIAIRRRRRRAGTRADTTSGLPIYGLSLISSAPCSCGQRSGCRHCLPDRRRSGRLPYPCLRRASGNGGARVCQFEASCGPSPRPDGGDRSRACMRLATASLKEVRLPVEQSTSLLPRRRRARRCAAPKQDHDEAGLSCQLRLREEEAAPRAEARRRRPGRQDVSALPAEKVARHRPAATEQARVAVVACPGGLLSAAEPAGSRR